MFMRIIWGKIAPGKWDEYEAAYKEAMEIRGDVDGLLRQWLVRDENDPDAGFSIAIYREKKEMDEFWASPGRKDALALLEPFYVNQYTITNCEVKLTIKE